jgi:hypothetical protein
VIIFICRDETDLIKEINCQIVGPGDVRTDAEIIQLETIMRNMIDTNTKFKLNYSNEQVRTLHSACRTSIQKKTQEKFFHAVACIYISYCT